MSKTTLMLASNSKARNEMLNQAEVIFEKLPADIDEYSLIKNLLSKNTSYDDIATQLSQEKALKVSNSNREKYIIGSDQLLIFQNKIFSKSTNLQEAKNKLQQLNNKTHQLISGVAVAYNGKVLWSYVDTIELTMHALSDDEIDKYIENNKDICLSCVGGYAIEGAGVKLFKEIKGDFFTIMGMPLLPLLNFLRSEGLT